MFLKTPFVGTIMEIFVRSSTYNLEILRDNVRSSFKWGGFARNRLTRNWVFQYVRGGLENDF